MLRKIIELSPVPVSFVKFIPSMMGENTICYGRYQYADLYRECIDIKKGLRLQEKIGVLLHEIGHAKCDEDGCICASKNTWKGEYHADMFALKWLLDNKQKKALGIRMRHIKNHTQDTNIYSLAALVTMRTDLWAECREYVKLSWIRKITSRMMRDWL